MDVPEPVGLAMIRSAYAGTLRVRIHFRALFWKCERPRVSKRLEMGPLAYRLSYLCDLSRASANLADLTRSSSKYPCGVLNDTYEQ